MIRDLEELDESESFAEFRFFPRNWAVVSQAFSTVSFTSVCKGV